MTLVWVLLDLVRAEQLYCGDQYNGTSLGIIKYGESRTITPVILYCVWIKTHDRVSGICCND